MVKMLINRNRLVLVGGVKKTIIIRFDKTVHATLCYFEVQMDIPGNAETKHIFTEQL